MDPTKQVWYSTAIVVHETERAEYLAVHQQTQSVEATQVAQFPVPCGNKNSKSVSPDGKWLATSCGYKSDQTLVVQNKDGTRWVLVFGDFVSPDSPEGISGGLSPKFWSADGNYLYFSIGLGYSGGGDDCFPDTIGEYGLFRLNLRTGTWTTPIPSTDAFPGYDIKFSPTGRRYAADIDGVTIVDLKTGEVTQLDIPNAMDLIWSPDGQYLAFSGAICGEERVESSSVYVWDALTDQTQLLYTTENILLKPESWADSLTLRIRGEERIDLDTLYTIYVFDILSKSLLLTGTATPYPIK
jgi:Tol biopolymer transport system component